MSESPVEGPDVGGLNVDPSVGYSLVGELDADHG